MPGKCQIDPNTYVVYCVGTGLYTSMFDSLSFTFSSLSNSITVSIPASDYVVISDDKTIAMLKLLVIPNLSTVILGAPYMEHVYLHISVNDLISIGLDPYYSF